MKYNGPKVKISRKLGLELTPKARKVTQKKSYGPGQHGPSRRRSKQSDYGRQLLEKQRLRLQYNISEKQMSNYYKKASKLVGNTGDLLVQLLESRLDAFVYRAGLAPTIYAARQYVSHGHIEVNGRRVNIPSYLLKPNDLVTVREKSRKHIGIQESIRNATAPGYIELSKADFSARYLNIPERDDVPVICEVPLVVEYYSR
jgi:small subunit ribosomal protein S4